MGRRHYKRAGLYAIVILFTGWTLIQLFSAIGQKPQNDDTARLLYQVSLFQVELLTSSLKEARLAKGTDELNGLKQAAYSAGYTHEKLTLALGEDSLTPLQSLSELQQYVTRLQIGGDRPLKPDEAAVFSELYTSYQSIYDEYAELLSSGGRVISSKNDKIGKIDKSIAEELRKRYLQ